MDARLKHCLAFALGAAGAWWASTAARSDSPASPAFAAVDDARLLALQAENARLVTELQRTAIERSEGSLREPALTAPKHSDPVHSATELLLRELEDAARSGAVSATYRDPVDLAELVIRIWTGGGKPQRAYDVYEALLALGVSEGDYLHSPLPDIASAFLASGDTAQASALFLQAYQNRPGDFDVLRQVAHLAPADALALLDRLEATGRSDGFDIRLQRAFLQTGVPSARAAGWQFFDRLIATDFKEWQLLVTDTDTDLLRALIAQDPAGAARCIEAQIRAAGSDEWLSEQLADAQVAIGRTADAADTLLATLLKDPTRDSTLSRLLSIDAQKAVTVLEQQIRGAPTPYGWARYSKALSISGQTQEAEAALQSAWEIGSRSNDISDGWRLLLLELQPDTYGPRIADLVLGDCHRGSIELCGDSFWRAGKHTEAIRLWQAAERVASEWPTRTKLRKARLGIDPLAP